MVDFRERSSFHNPGAHGLEVAGEHEPVGGLSEGLRVSEGLLGAVASVEQLSGKRQREAGSGGLHSGNALESPLKLREQVGPVEGLGVLGEGEAYIKGEQPVCLIARVHRVELSEAPHHESGTDEEHHGQRNLPHDHSVSYHPATSPERRASTLLQGVGQVQT